MLTNNTENDASLTKAESITGHRDLKNKSKSVEKENHSDRKRVGVFQKLEGV